MLILYRFLIQLFTPLLKFHLKRRLRQGKEEPSRLYERFGGASLNRPKGKLLWIHAASVGESVSVLQMIMDLRRNYPLIHILLTTGTVTSARLMSQRLPKEVIHQYIPLDVPFWIERFLAHWQPDEAIFLESELWPNMLTAIKKRSIPLLLLNASLSEKSYRRWSYVKPVARQIFSYFDQILTPSLDTAIRLKEIGIQSVEMSTNLKFTADPLPVNGEELEHLKQVIARPLFAAISTHPGEEKKVLEAYLKLKQNHPTLLLILAPRHPDRAEEIKELCHQKHLKIKQRSLKGVPENADDVWLVDTIGDLGLIYSLVPFCFLGGSLVPVGGHNVIEAYALGCVVIQGPQTYKSTHVNVILEPVLKTVISTDELIVAVEDYLSDPNKVLQLQQQAKLILDEQRQGLNEIIAKVVEIIQ